MNIDRLPTQGLIPWNSTARIEIENKSAVLTLFPPYMSQDLQGNQQELKRSLNSKLANALEKTTNSFLLKQELMDEQGWKELLSACESNQVYQALACHLALIKELQSQTYSTADKEIYLMWSLKLTLLQLKDESALQSKVDALGKQILQTKEYEICQRSEEESNNPSYYLINKKSKQPFALLKLPKKERFSSFGVELPGLPKLAPVWQHDLMAYEQTELFGLGTMPATLAVEVDVDGTKQRGVIQAFIPQTVTAGELSYQEKGADLLLSLPTLIAHRLALSSLFLGFAAGHGANYVVQKSEDGTELIDGYIIDCKETFIPINRVTPQMRVKRIEEIQVDLAKIEEELKLVSKETNSDLYQQKENQIIKLKAQIETVYQSIVVMRLWILGLNQNKQPFSRAALLAFSHPSLLVQLKNYHEKVKGYYHVSQEALMAQLERVTIMQKMCSKELEKQQIELTPRDLFFEICGGKQLYKIGKEKGYPDLVLFAHLISDPYHYAQKDFADHDSIPVSTLLKKPSQPK